MTNERVRKFKTIFISDIHLGTRGCQADLLLDFLRNTDADRYYLVGDIVDGWQLERSWYWPAKHSEVMQTFFAKAKAGAEIICIPGNHDEVFRRYCGTHFAGVEVKLHDMYITEDGRKFLVVHGDEFDGVVRYARWLAVLGHYAYGAALRLNTFFNMMRRWLGMDYWSLSAWLKFKVKNAVQFICSFEDALSDEARRLGADGVICGHIHHADMKMIDDILYVNDGDWVESCSAFVEHTDGRLEILHWAKEVADREARRRSVREIVEAAA